MPLDFTLAHTASGDWQGGIPSSSRALLSSAVYNSLQGVIFRTGGQIDVVIYGETFLHTEGFPSRKVSTTATSSVLLFQRSCTEYNTTVGSLFLC